MTPRVSIIIPIHDMENGAFFLWRAVNSVLEQSFKDYEIIITKEGKMAENTNTGIRKAKGELIKILFMDDYFSSEYALDDIVMHFEQLDNWMMTGCDTNPHPLWTDDIETGNNKLGSPSCLTFRNGLNMYFDENMSWLLDCDFYERMKEKYGLPKILDTKNIIIGIHEGQMTNILTDEEKLSEHIYMQQKYA